MSSEQNNADSTPLAGVVVWYNPTENEVENIKTYLDFVNTIYVVDNSATDNCALLADLVLATDKIRYLPNLDNLGIATALNKGCTRAVEDGYDWILTMDQDSCFDSAQMTEYLVSFENKRIEDPSIALFAPWTNEYNPTGYTSRVITSGNLLSLVAYQKIGGLTTHCSLTKLTTTCAINWPS